MKQLSSYAFFCLSTVMFGLVLYSTVSIAATFYVSTNGNDSNNGMTSTSSWRQISFAVTNSLVSSGSVVNVGAGEYIETVIDISTPITLNGTNLYVASNPNLGRHISRTIIKPQSTNDPLRPMQIRVMTNGVTIQNLTIDGDPDTNGIPDIMYGIYSTNRPVNINHCIIKNISVYGIMCWGLNPYPATNDTDAVRSYLGYNLLTNITPTNAGAASAIYMNMAPATCEFNEIAGSTGVTGNIGIYVYQCKYTTVTTNWVLIRSNYLQRCTTAIWANDFGGPGEKIILTGNTIDNGLIGIRVTAAEGQAIISSNIISVGGVSTSGSATPARGIWIHADQNPWVASNATDHLVLGNIITGTSISTDKTVGLLFAYDTSIAGNMNNGVRATALNNSISGFDFGAYVSSGTNGVSQSNSPLVRLVFHTNDFFNNISYGLYATNTTEMINASNNWWGYYFGPTGMYGNAVTTNNVLFSWQQGAYWIDSNGNGTNDWLDPDDDGDALLDTNEMAIGTSPAKSDTDGDGLKDPSELYAGTDPTNALSVFKFYRINIPQSSNQVEVTWSSVTNKKYNVYRTTNMVTGFAAPLTSNIIGNGSTNTYTDTTFSASVPFYFYRVTVSN